MSEELSLIDDDEEQTLVLDEDEIEVDGVDYDNSEGDFDDFDDADYDDMEDEAPKATGYRPFSNVYTVMIVLTFAAYATALTITLLELRDYCVEDQFLWGLFKN